MPDEKNDELKPFQIGLMSGVSTTAKKKSLSEQLEISKDEFPKLSALTRARASFKKKATERIQTLKSEAKSEAAAADDKERAEKAQKAWERAMEVISQLSIKD